MNRNEELLDSCDAARLEVSQLRVALEGLIGGLRVNGTGTAAGDSNVPCPDPVHLTAATRALVDAAEGLYCPEGDGMWAVALSAWAGIRQTHVSAFMLWHGWWNCETVWSR